MERSNISMIALAWFRPGEWRQIKRLCPDLQATYAEWLANAGLPWTTSSPVYRGGRRCLNVQSARLKKCG
jgi:hypothetical protein